MAQNIHIGCDHAALDLKNIIIRQLEERGLTVTDHGTYTPESCDYPDIAHDVAQAVEKENGTGILLCGTGIGMSMAANHHKGIRAALCTTELHAKLARRHNDANILCLGARIIDEETAENLVKIFLTTEFEGGKHLKRISMFS